MEVKVDQLVEVMIEAFHSHKEFVLPLKGTSMEPFFHTNDQAVLVKASKLKRLDAILYKRSNGQYVFHRIIHKKKDYYLVTGDNQTKLEKVTNDQILGKMIAFYKKNKLVSVSKLSYRFKVFLWSFYLIRKPILFIKYHF